MRNNHRRASTAKKVTTVTLQFGIIIGAKTAFNGTQRVHVHPVKVQNFLSHNVYIKRTKNLDI